MRPEWRKDAAERFKSRINDHRITVERLSQERLVRQLESEKAALEQTCAELEKKYSRSVEEIEQINQIKAQEILALRKQIENLQATQNQEREQLDGVRRELSDLKQSVESMKDQLDQQFLALLNENHGLKKIQVQSGKEFNALREQMKREMEEFKTKIQQDAQVSLEEKAPVHFHFPLEEVHDVSPSFFERLKKWWLEPVTTVSLPSPFKKPADS